jgi:hypothetical protein
MSCTPGGLGDRLSKLRQPAFYGGSGDGGVMQRVLNMPLPEDQLGEIENFSLCLKYQMAENLTFSMSIVGRNLFG